MYQVIYYSKSGNTGKLADAMAKELGVQATEVKTATFDRGPDILFLGTGCYGGQPGKDMVKLIETSDFRGRKVALFGTSGGGEGNEVKAMAVALKTKGADVVGQFYCRGQIALLFSHGHPNEADLAAARKFAREMARLG